MTSHGEAASSEKSSTSIDLRSDTLSRPTRSMKLAALNAELGDDIFGEDPTVKKLEKQVAALLGKEAGIFVSSGTMGNLVAIMCHCDVRGSEAYCGEESHVYLHEQVGAVQLAGVSLSLLPNNKDGTFDLSKLESRLRRAGSLHEPVSRLVLLENTNNGKVLPQSWVEQVSDFAKKRGLLLHLDGARLWNACAASGKPLRELAAPFDSVTVCLSKGLGAPVGSVLCGDEAFVYKARRARKVLGGATRQAGFLAAVGIAAIEEIRPLLEGDHKRALRLAEAINALGSPRFRVDQSLVHTNMVFVNLTGVTPTEFSKELAAVDDVDDVVVKANPFGPFAVRFVLYYEINDEMLDAAIRKIARVVRTLDERP